jgi:hypothetical protein
MPDLKINLPFSRYEYRLVGIYQITFDTGEFYIGSSGHVRSRASNWYSLFNDPSKVKPSLQIDERLVARIKQGGSAVFELIELCALDDLRDREAEYLAKFKNNPFMLSSWRCSWKAVIQYKKDGHFIKKHVSISAAAKHMNTSIGRIQDVLNGVRVSHRDMIFVYENDYEGRRKQIIKNRHTFLELPKKTKKIKIAQYLDNQLIATYETYAAAGRAVSTDPVNIKRAICGRQKTAAGFVWKFADAS